MSAKLKVKNNGPESLLVTVGGSAETIEAGDSSAFIVEKGLPLDVRVVGDSSGGASVGAGGEAPPVGVDPVFRALLEAGRFTAADFDAGRAVVDVPGRGRINVDIASYGGARADTEAEPGRSILAGQRSSWTFAPPTFPDRPDATYKEIIDRIIVVAGQSTPGDWVGGAGHGVNQNPRPPSGGSPAVPPSGGGVDVPQG